MEWQYQREGTKVKKKKEPDLFSVFIYFSLFYFFLMKSFLLLKKEKKKKTEEEQYAKNEQREPVKRDNLYFLNFNFS